MTAGPIELRSYGDTGLDDESFCVGCARSSGQVIAKAANASNRQSIIFPIGDFRIE